MIDFLGTLAPEHGLAEGFRVSPPQPPRDLLWRAIVGLADREAVGDAVATTGPGPRARVLQPGVVGAYGSARTSTVVRAVGEAVERFALFPQSAPTGTVTGTLREVRATQDALDVSGVALGNPVSTSHPLTWYPGRRVASGAATLVPAGLVDYPLAPGHPVGNDGRSWFDAGPSGAASGHGTAMALRNALLEIIERDAFLVAWQRQLVLTRLDVPAVLATPEHSARFTSRRGAVAELFRVWSRSTREGLRPRVVDIPTGVPGVVCSMGVVTHGGLPTPVTTVGCKASDDPVESMLGALMEALQVSSVAAAFDDDRALAGNPEAVVDDDDRLRFLVSRSGYAAVERWVSSFAQVRPPHPMTSVSDEELVEGVVADGADPVMVDLTHRLPSSLVTMGWAAVKVVPVGYQHLRIDERHQFSWNTARLASAEARTGCVAGLPTTLGPAHQAPGPHPLP